jgi:DNA-binding response OmpR family regulator
VIPKVLVADRQTEIGELFTRILEEDGSIACYSCDDHRDILRQVRQTSFALILVDVQIVFPDGFLLLSIIREICPDAFLLVMGHLKELKILNKALTLGASGYILKPVAARDLRRKVRECVGVLHAPTDDEGKMDRLFAGDEHSRPEGGMTVNEF